MVKFNMNDYISEKVNEDNNEIEWQSELNKFFSNGIATHSIKSSADVQENSMSEKIMVITMGNYACDANQLMNAAMVCFESILFIGNDVEGVAVFLKS
ncbi:hypothetical protein AVEN_182629-1 [Araneus ventricosus]|uniref:Uncharacterized protein n=1 Tax=Araneus ventricosus TaxID=182803 RepID=A0A4Y2K9L1_ARAVE|nr:hypothetical protein AVEN_182629-1 [Araneus ventricosus]